MNPISLEVYHAVVEPNLTHSQELVLNVFRGRNGTLTCLELAAILGKTPNELSGRLKELEIKGELIKEKRLCTLAKHNKKVGAWKLARPAEQTNLF